MPELLENIPPWIIQLGVALGVGIWIVQKLFTNVVPRIANASTRSKLMKAEAKVIALSHELEAQTRLHEQVESFFRQQVEYYKLDVSEEEIDQVGRVKYLMSRVTEAETSLKKHQNLIQGFFDNSPFTMLVKDKYSRILMVNRPDEEIWDRPTSEIVGAKVRDRFPEIGDIVEANDARARATMAVSEVVHDNIDAEGKPIRVRAITFPIMENGEYNGVVGTIDVILPPETINGTMKDLIEDLKDV